MRREILAALIALFLATLACGVETPGPGTPIPSLQHSVFDEGRTVYGFFPTPPEVSLTSVLNHFKILGEHADFILLQPNVPWEEFVSGVEGKSPKRTDIHNQVTLARQNGLDVIFVVDPLNGLNRREFFGLPADWEASFANPHVRAAFTNFTLWIVRQFRPRYLGLASEINTYADAHPDDFPNYLSLYSDVYDMVKAEAPETKVFVTFQWEDLNNLIPWAAEGRQPYQTNWDQVEAFEPKLDIWAISSYPFVVFETGADIPDDYYTPLFAQTNKPLAVAEGGFTSEDVGPFHGTPQDQVDYLTAIQTQIGDRLTFWVYLLLTDFNMDSYAKAMRAQGFAEDDISNLGMFAAVGLCEWDGTPKPGLEVWDSFRSDQ